jgi:hypothetical protein
VSRSIGIHVDAYDLAMIIDPEGEGIDTTQDVDQAEDPFRQREALSTC